MGKVQNFLRSFSALHISPFLLPWAPWAVCRAESSGSPIDASQSSVTPELSGTELVVTVTCPQCNAAFCSPKGWLVPKAAKYLQLPLNSRTWEKTHENLTWETKPPEESLGLPTYLLISFKETQQAFYKLKDVFILTQSRLRIPAITTSQLQSQDIITRHPCLPLGEFFSNATMRERNVMEVPPTPSATPHWYFILVLFLLPTQQIWLFQSPSQKHSKPQFISSGHFLRLQNWDTVQCNPGTHPLRTDQAEVDAVPTEQHIMTAVIDFPQPNSAVLKSPVSGGAVAKDDTSKRFFAWHERCWMVARLGSSTSP